MRADGVGRYRAVGMGQSPRLKRSGCAAALGLALALALALFGGGVAQAQPQPQPPLVGQPPSDAAVKAAVLKHLQAAGQPINQRKPFRILSGPTLATGNTFGGERQQAWLVCIVVNAEKIAPGPQQLQGQALYLRRRGALAVVVPVDNWRDSSPQCSS